jgi:hypothetical protein
MNLPLKGRASPRRCGERTTNRIRDVRQHDFCPASDVTRSDAVGMTSAATLDAFKDRLRRSVGIRGVPALGAFPARVARVNEEHGHTGTFCLVLDKRPQLAKRPARELSALLPSHSPRLQAYALEVFEGNSSLRAFGKPNKLFANDVVGIGNKPLLFARLLLQAAFRGVRVLPLKLRPEPSVAAPHGVDDGATTDVAIRVYRYVLEAQIHPDNAFCNERLGVFDFARGEQVDLATPVHEVGFSYPGLEQLHLPLSGHKRDVLSPGDGPDRCRGFVEVPRKDAVVIGNRAPRFEPPLAPLIQPVRIPDFGKATDHHLSRKPKLRPHVFVAELLQSVLPERPLLPGYIRDVVAGRVGPLKRLFQEPRLFWRGPQLELSYQFHILKLCHGNGGSSMDYLVARPRFLPSAKAGVMEPEQLR